MRGKVTPPEHTTTLKEYYKTKWWRELRKSYTDDKACSCDICGKKRWEKYIRKDIYKKPMRIDIHHKNYDHLYKEKVEDILKLCSSCHSFAHDLEMMARTRGGIYLVMYQEFMDNTPWVFAKRDRP